MTDIGASGNVIRITNQRSQGVYVTYILRVLQGGADKNGEEHPKFDSVTISAMGRAIHSAVNVAEIIKRRVVGLHQITSISSQTVDDTDADDAQDNGRKEKGARKASVITIQLSRRPLNTKDIGYQAPLPESMVTDEEPREARAPRSAQPGGARGGNSRGGARGGARGGDRGGVRGGARGGDRGGVRGGARGGPRGGRGGSTRGAH